MPVLKPAFGQADLSNCEREQIHIAGSIQPHGVLLVVREPDFIIVQASANTSEFLGVRFDVLGQPLARIEGDLMARITPLLHAPLAEIPAVVRCRLGSSQLQYDGTVHRPPAGGLIIELERAGTRKTAPNDVEEALQTILAAPSLRALCDEAAAIFKSVTGYDRVMIYRFDDDGHGEVFSERREPELEPYLGNRYPASDIPQIARRLYERNRVRMIADVGYGPVPLRPVLSPISGEDLDLSLCVLRSMSPIHVQYLKNMGVAATLVMSLVVGKRLWGLVACHHYVPRIVHFEIRAVCELLAESVSTRIAALESFLRAQSELAARRLEHRLVQAVARDGDWKIALFDRSNSLLQPLGAAGAALLFEGELLTLGEVPGTQQLRDIAAWLDRSPKRPLIATNSLGIDMPEFAAIADVASGLLAAPLSRTPGDYLIWFRPEQVRTVTWGGDPNKPFIGGDNPAELSPRRSFAQWHQLVEGTSEPWTEADLSAGNLISETIIDVVMQFRSVRMLIAQDQLDQISKQVELSDQPVLIADVQGRVLLMNNLLKVLLANTNPLPQSLDELAGCFEEPGALEGHFGELLAERRSWRGEVRVAAVSGASIPLLIRADPVIAWPNRVLGMTVLFTDLTERKAAEAARRRFQEELVDEHRLATSRLDTRADLIYRTLLTSVIENAQLAALEISDELDVTKMPEMLDSVRASAQRAAEILEHLVKHASPGLSNGERS
ncbi:MAG: GAF domain-containing protein [Alphaproteobacteria bacterium]|nr:GAF domain-containing protein [Alphaproteobacteria bacterium]